MMFFCLMVITAFSQENQTKTSILVRGNCEMCKTAIENAVSTEPSATGEWNIKTKVLNLNFNKKKTSLQKIMRRVAQAGYDNQLYTADDSVYKNLDACCLYDRITPWEQITNSAGTHLPEEDDHEHEHQHNPEHINTHLSDSHKTLNVMVRGNCEMCKSNIENAVKAVATAQGDWNTETKVLTVSFDEKITSISEILKSVAEAGYDNEMFTAEDEDYENLAACCLYDRTTPWEMIEQSANTHSDGMQENQSEVEAEENSELSEKHADEISEEDVETSDNTVTLSGVTIEGSREATALDGKSIALSYNIDAGELLKAACCNLSESFETNATVDVNYGNAVTGAKQIKMLGLDQKYTLITKELIPDIRGLAVPYGMNFLPGRWISGIQLTKGGSTVTNGYESISGQINTELWKTHNKTKTSLNLFADLNSRFEANVVHADSINSKWSHTFLGHGNTILNRMDTNEDGFMDQPVGRQLNAAYLLNYQDLDNSGWATHFGLGLLDDHRLSGQMDFIENSDQLTANRYGVGIDISRFQAWNKTGYIFKGKPWQSIGWMNQFTYHEQNSYFGLTPYQGTERTVYSNLIFESILGQPRHKYKAGASFMYDDFDELYWVQKFERTETVPGGFLEYTYDGEKFTAVLGTRVDFHNLAGTQVTPRINVKYDLFPKTTLRGSAGRGFRTANIFAESQAYMASNRNIVIEESSGNIYGLDAETAWNYGISVHQELMMFGRKSNIIADFFRTDFENQILPDLDASPQEIRFYNMKGESFANALQIQWDFEPVRRLDARLAYKTYSTQADYSSGKKEIPFTAKHRGFMNLSYSTFKRANGSQWSFDSTLQWVGEQRIPDTTSNPQEFQLPAYSDPYFLLNGQIARQMNKNIRLYVGAENLLGYTQENPILDVQNPFSNYFDGGMVWAPVMPVNMYFGLDVEF